MVALRRAPARSARRRRRRRAAGRAGARRAARASGTRTRARPAGPPRAAGRRSPAPRGSTTAARAARPPRAGRRRPGSRRPAAARGCPRPRSAQSSSLGVDDTDSQKLLGSRPVVSRIVLTARRLCARSPAAAPATAGISTGSRCAPASIRSPGPRTRSAARGSTCST